MSESIVCTSLSHFSAKILSEGIVLQTRQILGGCSDMEVKNCLNLPHKVLKSVPVIVTPALEIVITEPLILTFEENALFYCIFWYERLSLMFVPEWFPQVMVCQKDSSIEITNKHNTPISKIEIKRSEFSFNKFDLITGTTD